MKATAPTRSAVTIPQEEGSRAADSPGRLVLRRLLPAAIGVPLLVGFLRLLGQHAGLYGTTVGVGLMTVEVIVIGAGLLFYFARSLDRKESERLEAHAQLARNARHFELSRDMACTASFDGYFQRLNAAWTQTLGWTQDELRSRPFVEFVHPDDRDSTERESAGLAEGGVSVGFTNRYATKDGGWRWIDWQAMASMEDGVIYASARDVTDRKLAEAALAASAHQARHILDMAHDAFVSIDAQGAIIEWNIAAESTFGWSRREVLGRPLSETIIPAGHRDAHDQGIERYLATGEQRVLGERLEMTACHRDGRELPIELTICPLDTEQGITFNAFLRDISERREVERAKDEFISVVSHELRTPLTSIRGSLGLLAGGVLTTAPDKAEHMLEIAIDNSDRLVRLINDILDIERIESGRVQLDCRPCPAARLVDQAVDMMRAAALQAGVTLHVGDGDEMLWADPDRVLQTLTNLICNAIKFSPPGATVWLEYEHCEREVIFRVRDQGRGIPADSLERVFERFAQIDSSDARDKGGTGLGLPICRSIVEQHGGRIWAESLLGQGTTFFFTLPALGAAAPGACAVELPPPPPSAPGTGASVKRVIVVEDDSDLASVLIALFEGHGLQAVQAASGTEAVRLTGELEPDLLILDLGLPDGDGFWVAAWLRAHERLRHVPIVVYTARNLDTADRERLETGRTFFMTKGSGTLEQFELDVLELVGELPPDTTAGGHGR